MTRHVSGPCVAGLGLALVGGVSLVSLALALRRRPQADDVLAEQSGAPPEAVAWYENDEMLALAEVEDAWW